MKRDERGLTDVDSAPERTEPFAVVGARSAAADARQTSLALPRNWATRRGPNSHGSPVTNHCSRIIVYSHSTRHCVPSRFLANSLKTKKSGPSYSTQKRGVSIHAYSPQLSDFESHPCSTNRRCA